MVTLPLCRPLLGLLAAGGLLLAAPAAASAQDPTPTAEPAEEPTAEEPAAGAGAADSAACAVTGYVVGSSSERSELRDTLRSEPVHRVEGVSLDRVDTWLLPDGSTPVLVVDSTAPLSGGEVSVTVAGQRYPAVTDSFAEAQHRYVPGLSMPQLGPVTRTVGLEVESGSCTAAVVLSVDRGLLSTAVGGPAVAATVLFGLLTVLVARLRKGGWLRRFLSAALLGVATGISQAVVLYEAGVISPFTTFPYWLPAAGLALAALLPLTRWRRRTHPSPAAGPAPAWLPPEHAALGGFRPVAGFTRTAMGEVHRAVRPDSRDRALVKVVPADRAGEPGARLALEREAQLLPTVEHPNLVRLRETVHGDGPPTLVFDDVDGAPLREVAGRLSGPQAVTVALGVLAGLGVLHARGLVHRDLSPDTVWLAMERAGEVGGGVVVAGLELACPGVEHPLAPEGAAGPYASPEQRAGQVLDGRSDLYACAAMLRALSNQAEPPQVAALLDRALAEDREARPPSAEQFAADLRQAAYEGYGPDWVGRGALAGALAAHGAVGAAAAGYGVAGAAGMSGVAGAGTGTAGAAGLGPAGAAPAATGQAAAASVATTASSGKAGTLVNAGIAVVAGAVLGVTAVVVDAQPAQAQQVVITPEQARVIFVRTVDEGWGGDDQHLVEEAQEAFAAMLEQDEAIAGAELAEVAVGVPPDQVAYPAWFVGSAVISYGDGTISMFARFERESADEPWLMTMFNWSDDTVFAAPLLDGDWLAPPPDVADLLVDPGSLPEQYRAWLVRANEAVEVGSDEVLTLRYEEGGMIYWFAQEIPFFSGEDLAFFSYDYDMSTGEVTTDLVPLVDGTVHVVFTSVITQTSYNRPDGRSGSCDNVIIDGNPYHVALSWENNDPPGEFREATQDYVVSVEAWVPVPDALPEARPDGAEEGPDPERVLVEDWSYQTTNRAGEPC